jgi:nucleoside-diphosphate kinase
MNRGQVIPGVDFSRRAVILCKPDCVKRGLVDEVLDRIAAAGVTVSGRRDLVAQPWQAHVAYRDMLADTGIPALDVPACLDATYAGRDVTVALAHGEPGLHDRLRHLLGHFNPTQAATGTIRGDLGDDSLKAALAERRFVRNLVHTSDDPEAATATSAPGTAPPKAPCSPHRRPRWTSSPPLSTDPASHRRPP